ncbi:hypothetical protein DPX16_5767 [Anabarilius grahami]|uniref:Uncharacterized protein n=1 Tax=Anabarilius grahami TaxID=495550 RepID=A0A3N0YWA4_ANAGA|nr:hypothetical protein DPX16_5767 [Anabarilius grahami]
MVCRRCCCHREDKRSENGEQQVVYWLLTFSATCPITANSSSYVGMAMRAQISHFQRPDQPSAALPPGWEPIEHCLLNQRMQEK